MQTETETSLLVVTDSGISNAEYIHEVPEFFDLPFAASFCEMAAANMRHLAKGITDPVNAEEFDYYCSALNNLAMLMHVTNNLRNLEEQHRKDPTVRNMDFERKQAVGNADGYWIFLERCLNRISNGKRVLLKSTRYTNL